MQNYKNHIRFYTPHHFIFYPVIGILVGLSVREALTDTENSLLWVFIAMIFAMLGWLSFMVRQHYALTLQNRLVTAEMRLRYFVLTQQRLESMEDRLSFGQISTLRFAGDEELAELTQRAWNENLSPDGIKKAIRNWRPDNSRV